MSLWRQFHTRIGTSLGSSTRESLAQHEGAVGSVLPLVSLVLGLIVAGQAWGGAFSPPAPPKVAPVISEDYPNDLNGNRIADELEAATASAQGPSPGGEGKLSTTDLSDGMVAVELIFNEPVTQEQIDEFLRLGGRITYMYQAISYGWNGRISPQSISALPAAMGPTLVQVEAVGQLRYYMDTATQVGRVRPVWKAGFAGLTNGVRGDPNTTIGLLGGGVDATHADLKGRCVYWKDVTDDSEPAPADYNGHDTLVAGIATGTGVAGGQGEGELRFTYTYADADYPTWGHETDAIALPARQVTMKTYAWWAPGQTCVMDHFKWIRGTSGTGLTSAGNYIRSKSPGVLTNIFIGSLDHVYSSVLLDYDTRRPVENVTIITSVNPYPGVDDGFGRFSGVAPGCKWAAVKVFDREGYASSSGMTRGLDELVMASGELNIKIINISAGYYFLGIPSQNTSVRDKVNTAVSNGIIVVAAAGNGANDGLELLRRMADPARAAMALTVGASNDEDAVTEYSTYGFMAPRANLGEDYKPDIVAPGGSHLYTGILGPDSGTSDGIGMDKEPNDYASAVGTSFSAPFVSGAAALVIDAMQKQGVEWTFGSSDQPRYVKMLLCATASETNAPREGDLFNPSLDRAAPGPEGFPAGKDQQEGYGLINVDAAVEAVCQTYAPGSTVTGDLGGNSSAKRVWARTVNLKNACDITVSLTNPAGADFDIYLYSAVPSETGTPVILASSTTAKADDSESLQYAPTADATALLVVKRISGSGTFTLTSIQAGPPTAQDVTVTVGIDTPLTVTLAAVDDGSPVPPGAMTFVIASLPEHGQLEQLADGSVISQVPEALPVSTTQVIYRPDAGYVGPDSFTFYADDGGMPPFGGQSNTAVVHIDVVREITVECQVSAGADDASGLKYSTYQELNGAALVIGGSTSGMRFQNIQVPQGALIKSATLSICSYTYGLTGRIDAKLRADASDNAADFSARRAATVAGTNASQAWNWDGSAWTANTWYDSPDIAQVIQEVVDRPGWSPGNAMALIYSCTSYENDRRFWSYDGAPHKAARLKITYQPR